MHTQSDTIPHTVSSFHSDQMTYPAVLTAVGPSLQPPLARLPYHTCSPPTGPERCPTSMSWSGSTCLQKQDGLMFWLTESHKHFLTLKQFNQKIFWHIPSAQSCVDLRRKLSNIRSAAFLSRSAVTYTSSICVANTELEKPTVIFNITVHLFADFSNDLL